MHPELQNPFPNHGQQPATFKPQNMRTLDEELKQLDCERSIRQSLLENNITTIKQFVDVKDFSTILPRPWMKLRAEDLQLMLDPTKSSAEKKQEMQLREQETLEFLNNCVSKLQAEEAERLTRWAKIVKQAERAAKSTLPHSNLKK